jgi:hypothetical protein
MGSERTGEIGNRPVCLLVASLILLALTFAPSAQAASQPIGLAAPYEYLGWGDPQPPASVIATTGLHDLTMAFMLSKGKCNPEWDGYRPLLGGVEHGEFTNKKTRLRVVEALDVVQSDNPGLEISITMGTAESGPERDGVSLIADAAGIGFQPSTWTIMPFDFGAPSTDMGHASIRALEGLAGDLESAYHLSAAAAYEHSGVSSMNGETDEASETVGIEEFQTMVSFAEAHHLSRLTFWAVNRDRPCQAKAAPEEECGGIAQQPFAFSDLVAGYHG